MLSSRKLLLFAGLGALIAVMVVFAGLVSGPRTDMAYPVVEARPLAPATTTAPVTTSAKPATSTTATSSAPATTSATTSSATTSPTTSGTESAGTDARGFVNSAARCDADQTAVAIGRTQRSKVVICAEPSGGYNYHGVRISDGASLTASAEATGDGSFVVRADGSVYTVSPSDLAVTSGGKVIYRDTWMSYEAPTFSAEHGATASSTTTTATTTATTKPR